MSRRTKSVFERIAQRNRLFSKFAGVDSDYTSQRNKARIFRVLFDGDEPPTSRAELRQMARASIAASRRGEEDPKW